MRQSSKKAPGQRKKPAEVHEYMSNLGGGTGVDIGPGAAGEMSDTAQPASKTERQGTGGGVPRDWIYPDSGDMPRVQSDNSESDKSGPGNIGDV